MWNAHILVVALLLAQPGAPAHATRAGGGASGVPILLYHRFGSVAADSMTVTTATFASHLAYFQANGYTVIPLRNLVAYIAGGGPAPDERAVAITADDGHESVYTDMFPLIKRYHVPVTLFVYPSAISNAAYAMTWAQLREMRDSGLVDIQSHTYWHPNFKREKKRLSGAEYDSFVRLQLTRSREALERQLGGHVDMLAWPFGIYDRDLTDRARQARYLAGFTLERRRAGRGDDLMALPRYLMTDRMRGRLFAKLLTPLADRGGQEPSTRPGHEKN